MLCPATRSGKLAGASQLRSTSCGRSTSPTQSNYNDRGACAGDRSGVYRSLSKASLEDGLAIYIAPFFQLISHKLTKQNFVLLNLQRRVRGGHNQSHAEFLRPRLSSEGKRMLARSLLSSVIAVSSLLGQ